MLNLSMFLELAKDASKSGRKKLVSAITDLFVASQNEEAEQVSLLFGDIVMRVLGELEEETRMALAQRVSDHPAAPHSLINNLAHDTIVVAKPILEQSPVLTTSDLTDLAGSTSMEHLDAIAHRADLDEEVSEALVTHGDEEVMTTLANNAGARLAQDTFMRLVERARSNKGLLEALAKREDLPNTVFETLGTMVSEELRDRLSMVGGEAKLAESMADRAIEEVKARASRVSQNMDQAKKIIASVQAGSMSLAEGVSLFAKGDRAAELGFLLATVNGLPLTSVSSLIYAKSDKPLVILCKANGMELEGFKHILTMRARRLGTGVHELNDAMNRYQGFSAQAARSALDELRKSMADGQSATEEGEVIEPGVFLSSRRRSSANVS